MLLGQLKIMTAKKGFQISFTIMMLFALGTPIIYAIENLTSGNDIAMLPSKEYAFMFYTHSFLSQLTVYAIPLISSLTFSLSYVIDKKIGYQSLFISRMGSNSYFVSKYICCFIGGFIVIFLPSLINIAINQLFFPDTKQDIFMSSIYSNVVDDYLYINERIILNSGFTNLNLFLDHPQIYNGLMALCMSFLSGTCAVISYTVSLYLSEQYAYLSIFSGVILLLVEKKYYEMYQAGTIEKILFNMSLDDYGKSCSPNGKLYIFFAITILAINILAFLLVKLKTKRDQI